MFMSRFMFSIFTACSAPPKEYAALHLRYSSVPMFRYVSRYTLTSLMSPVSRLMLAIMVLSLRLSLNSWLSVFASTPNRAMFL